MRIPPRELPAIPLLPWQRSLWRLHNGPALNYRRYPTPWYRYDAPSGEYAAVYASAERLTTFAEVFRGRGGRLVEVDADRYLVRLTPARPLGLVDLRDHATLVALGLDERISVGDDYAACQAWALAFHRASPDAMGMCYRSRLAGPLATKVVLFAERAAGHLEVVSEGRLRDLEMVVMAAADRFNLTVLFPFE